MRKIKYHSVFNIQRTVVLATTTSAPICTQVAANLFMDIALSANKIRRFQCMCACAICVACSGEVMTPL